MRMAGAATAAGMRGAGAGAGADAAVEAMRVGAFAVAQKTGAVEDRARRGRGLADCRR